MKRRKRLRILSNSEINDLYGRPQFSDEDRIEYFSLSTAEKLIIEDLRLLKSKVSFILKLGYFKAKHLFFAINFLDFIHPNPLPNLTSYTPKPFFL